MAGTFSISTIAVRGDHRESLLSRTALRMLQPQLHISDVHPSPRIYEQIPRVLFWLDTAWEVLWPSRQLRATPASKPVR